METSESIPVTQARVMDALREVLDPELGCSIVDLGLIYSVDIQNRHVTVTMSLTTRGCPMQERLARAAKIAVRRLDPVEQAEVRVVWDPPWTPSMMSASLRARFGAAFNRGCGGGALQALVLGILVGALGMVASGAAEGLEPVPLWTGPAPGALGTEAKDIPTLTPYLPDAAQASGAAIVICPGGGYGALAGHEGHDYALWLNQHGVAGFVLKYRLGSQGYRHPVMLGDAARAVRLVRARAETWGVDPKRVGIMGSSAGGHLASTLVTHFDGGRPDAEDEVERQSSRPDLGILCYAVITLGEHTHQGSKRNLLGPEPSEALVRLLSNELQVTPQTPPCFVWHTWEDQAVPVENSLQFAAALRRAGVPFDLHIYQQGRHGIGLRDQPPFEKPHPWAADCLFWLRVQGFAR